MKLSNFKLKLIFSLFVTILLSTFCINLCARNRRTSYNEEEKLDTTKTTSSQAIISILKQQPFWNNEEIKEAFEAKLSATEDRIRDYIDTKFYNLENKLDSLSQEAKKERQKEPAIAEKRLTIQNNLKAKKIAKVEEEDTTDTDDFRTEIAQLAKKKIDSRIKDEVKKQLSFLREDRVDKLERLAELKRKEKKKKMLRRLLEENLDDDIDY